MITKKGISVLLVFLLLASNSGLALNVHFCAGQIASVKATLHSGELKSGCGMETSKSHGCCQDKVIKSGNKRDVVVSPVLLVLSVFVPPTIADLPYSSVLIDSGKTGTTAYYCDAHGPPLFRLYSQYIFYA
jgi:hypothetical protein